MPDCSELSVRITRIATNLAKRENVHGLDDVVKEMQGYFPDIRREFIVNAIVEATTRAGRTIKETQAKIQQLKNQARRESIPYQTQKLEKQIDALSKKIEKGEIEIKRPEPTITNEAIEELKAERKAMNEELATLRTQSPEVQKEKIQHQIEGLQKKLESEDILPREKIKTPYDKELLKAEFERDQLKGAIRDKLYKLKPMSIGERIGAAFDMARILQTTGEFSVVLRQGGVFAYGHPLQMTGFIIDMLKAFASPQAAWEINNKILNRPLAPVAARAKLHMSVLDGTEALSHMEEEVMSRLGIGLPVIRNFTRATLTYMNLLRAGWFDTLYHTAGRIDSLTENEAKITANAVNVLSGRGPLTATGEKAAVLLNRGFYAPKYVASRFQTAVGYPIWSNIGEGSMRIRAAIAYEYARFLVGFATAYSMAILAGADVEWDPRSTDFGKWRWGNTRIDPMMGISQVTVFLTRMVTGQTKNAKGQIVPLYGDDRPYGGTTMSDVFWRFLRGKVSPAIGTAFNLIFREDYVGRPVSISREARNLLIPIAWNDVYDAMIEQGVPKATAMSVLATFGTGLQTYQENNKKGTTLVIKPIRMNE